MMVPWPPKSEVPPMTTAAITVSSSPALAVGETEVMGEAERAGERGGDRAEDEADHLDTSNRNPGRRRAAVSLLPVACTQ